MPPTTGESPAHPADHRAALAQIAGGISPALCDLLMVIAGRTSLLLDSPAPDAESRLALRQIYVAAERASALVRQLALIAASEPPPAHLTDLNELLGKCRRELQRLGGDAVEIALQPAPSPVPVRIAPDVFEQLLLALTLNAVEAMPQGGRLVIALAVERRSAPGANAAPEEFAVIRISDTGRGIAPEVQPRLFEPFFTTKVDPPHAGLGLAAVAAIARQHRGWVEVASPAGAGAEFRVFLPVSAAPPVVAEAAPPTGAGGETLLVVDDDAAVRDFTVALLQAHGYRVLQAGSAADALEVWRWHAPRIRLLVSDLVLDDHDGLALAREFRAARPALAVICMSGAVPSAEARAAVAAGECVFLPKPCRPQSLFEAVRTLLDRKSS